MSCEYFNREGLSQYDVNDFVLTEKDFYPPEDNRFYSSKVRNIPYGDNFNDFINDYWLLCEKEGIFDE